MTRRYHGIFTPLVTPLLPDESPDLTSLERLVQFQTESGVHGLWAMGTTSEFASFDRDERAAVVATVVGAANGLVPVIANVSDASTRGAIEHGRRAEAAGADAIAATPPYYFPHTQDELLAHYRAIRAAVDLPLFLYNIPQTVRVRIELPAARTLMTEGTVAGIKDSQNDFDWLRRLVLAARSARPDFVTFAGTRSLIDAAVLIGADGAIPSAANAFPGECVAVYSAAAGLAATSGATEAQALIITLENISGLATEGSRNAAVLGFLKTVLHGRGIINSPALTAPLRTPTEAEQREMRVRVEELVGAAAQV